MLKLADLTKLYTKRLEQLGSKSTIHVHSTDLKNRILSSLPDLQAYRKGRDIFLAFDDDIDSALKIISEDSDDEAVILSKAANIVRRKMREMECVFDGGKFRTNCQKDSVPESFIYLVSMVLRGSNIKTNIDSTCTISVDYCTAFTI